MPIGIETRLHEDTAVVLTINYGPSFAVLQFDNLVECLDYIRDLPEARSGDWNAFTISLVPEVQQALTTHGHVLGYYATCECCEQAITSSTGHAGQWLTKALVGRPGSSQCPDPCNRHLHGPGTRVLVKREGDEEIMVESLREARVSAREGSQTAADEARQIMADMVLMGMPIPVSPDTAVSDCPWDISCEKCTELARDLHRNGPMLALLAATAQHLDHAHGAQVTSD